MTLYQTLGVHSPVLAAIRALGSKKGRREQHRFIIEGMTLVAEAIEAGLAPELVVVTEAARPVADRLLPSAAAPRYLVPEAVMRRLSDLETPPGLLVVVPSRLAPLASVLDGGPALALGGVADPGNAGTLVRSAEIFGVRRIVFARDGVEPYNPKVVRASMGALFRSSIAVASADELQHLARSRDYRVIATATRGTPLPSYRFPERPLIVIGGERRGVGGWLGQWDEEVTIPQPGGGESLNLAVAGSIVLYAFSSAQSPALSSLGGHLEPCYTPPRTSPRPDLEDERKGD